MLHDQLTNIQKYLHHCAKKYDIKRHIQYNQSVNKTEFNTTNNTWTTFLASGQQIVSRYIVAATGILSQPITPNIKGLDTFKGKMMHTAQWDNDYDLTNKRVGVIGTGASAVQVVPSIAKIVSELSVFQRTPAWINRLKSFVGTTIMHKG